MTAKNRIGVLVVDDSHSVRAAFERLLASEPGIDIVGLAADPYEAVQIMRDVVPDVVILDIVMPRMDGLTFLTKIMTQHPLPVIICSSQVSPDSGKAVLALERGAVEVVPKPSIGAEGDFESAREPMLRAIRAAAGARVERRLATSLSLPRRPGVIAKPGARSRRTAPGRVVVIGASTGGTEALRYILSELPSDVPGIVVAQHMPPGFTAAFARRLDELCDLSVVEAAGNEPIVAGSAIIAPGNRHLRVRAGSDPKVLVSDSEPVNRHRPSVDVLFRSAASEFGANALGILLTGMGRDGAEGLAEMLAAGAETVAQDEETSVVFGMPAAAIKLGGASRVLPVQDVAAEIVRWADEGTRYLAAAPSRPPPAWQVRGQTAGNRCLTRRTTARSHVPSSRSRSGRPRHAAADRREVRGSHSSDTMLVATTPW